MVNNFLNNKIMKYKEKSMPDNLNILDCTLRDGGYYNNWDFNINLIREHLTVLERCKINIVEIGFRSLINNEYKGPLAFTSDDFLEGIECKKIKIAVMINAKELDNKADIKNKIDKLFPIYKNNSKVNIVRIACNFRELENAKIASGYLNEKGYEVCINIMQGALLELESIKNIAKSLKSLNLNSVYLADSTGSMSSKEYNSKLSLLKNESGLEVGIHAHNNLGRALTNTLESINVGCKWLDATILGMGRGPGNADLEELLISLSPKYLKNLNLIPLVEHSEKWFLKLKEKYKWGKNRFYFLSGKYKIHPSYIQEMISDSRYSTAEIIGAIDYLKKDESRLYNSQKLLQARSFFKGESRGQDMPKDKIKEKTVLILGNGKGSEKFKNDLEKLIKIKKLYVIALNSNSKIDPKLIKARVFCHPMRLLADNNLFRDLNQLIITPYSMLPEKIQGQLKTNSVLDYGVKIQKNTIESNKYFCTISSPIALAYALGTIGATDIENIILAGFDGYPKGDIRNLEIENIFKIFKKNYSKINFYSITPTNYFNLDSKSIYGSSL